MLYDYTRDGLTFTCRKDTTDERIVNEVFAVYNKYFDVEDGESWYDFGAHIGSFSVYATSKGADVVAFEPVPENYDLLVRNLEQNNLDSFCIIHNKAVTKDGRDVEMVVTPYNYGACSTLMWTENEHITVPSIPARLVGLGMNTDDCIKMDIEGAEYEILGEFDLSKVKKLVLEFHHWLLPPAAKVEIASMLEQAEFSNIKFDRKTDTWHCWR